MMDVQSNDALVDVKMILRALRRRFWLAATSFVLTVALATVYTLNQTPIYDTAARLQLDTRNQNVVNLGDVLSGLPPNTAIIDTELQVIMSETLLRKVVPRLNLTEHPEYNWTLQEPSGFSKWRNDVRAMIGGWFGGGNAGASGDTEGETPPPAVMSKEQLQESVFNYALGRLQGAVSVSRMGPTYIIDIRARSSDPELAAAIANAVSEQYLVEQLEAKLEATRRANDWLAERLDNLRQEVNEKENAVEQYRASSGLLSAQGSTLTERTIADLTAERSVQGAQLQEVEARLNNVRNRLNSGAGLESVAEVLGSPVISNLRNQQAQIQRQRAELLTRYGPRHPDVESINNEVDDLRAQIDAEVSRIVASLESEVEIARGRVTSFDRSLGEARGMLAANNRATVRLRELEREAEASRALYEDFLRRFKQTSEQGNLAQADARILTTARVPGSPSSPRTKVNLALGIILGGAMAGALILLAELGENHFSSGEELERAFGVPHIGSIPLLPGLRGFGRSKKTPADYAIENPLSAFSESLRNLRASIIFADLDNPAKSVAICSSLPDEGKTMTTYALGRLSAMSGSRTLVIDGDFRRRQLTEAVGIAPENGLIEHLFGECGLDEAITIDEKTGLHILPLSRSRNTPRDVFGSRSFDNLLERLKQTYDLIVFDTGPILLMAESRVLVGKVDQVIVVAKWRSTRRASVQQTMNLLNQFHANIAGIVLNFVDLRRKRMLSESESGSYKAYSKYYMEGAR